MEKEQMKKRDRSLDVFRGIAVFSIVFIHCTFNSGGEYVPWYMRTVSLLLDVPFFMFLSGWSAAYSPRFDRMLVRLAGICLLWGIFFLVLDLIAWRVSGEAVGARYYVEQAFFIKMEAPYIFRAAGWSAWYMPVYLSVVPVGMLVIRYLEMSDNRKIGWLVLACLFAECWRFSLGRASWFGVGIRSDTVFYLFFFLAGYLAKDVVIKGRTLCLMVFLTCVAWMGSARILQVDPFDLQMSKFPPNIVYLTASLISIEMAIFLRGYLECLSELKIFNHLFDFLGKVGRNAIVFYCAQGVATSLLFYVMPYFLMPWPAKLLLAFCMASLLTMVLGGVLSLCVNRWITLGLKRIFLDA